MFKTEQYNEGEKEKMPELPEVETVRKGLERLVVGKTIQKVQVLWPKIIEQPETPIFEASLVGETIQSIGRRGSFNFSSRSL